MIHTFKGLRDEVFRLLDETSTDSPTTLALIKDALNQAHQQRCTEFPWGFMLWPRAETLTITGGQREYALHSEFYRPYYFWNRSSKRYLVEVPFRGLPQGLHDWVNDTGATEHFMYWGQSPVAAQPATPSVLSLVSSSASDTGASYNIVVKGEDSDGNVRGELLTPTGTTTASGAVTFKTILGVSKGASWNGTLTLSAGSTTLLSLISCEMGRQYKKIYCVEAGTSGETIEYRFFRQPTMLVNDYDVPDIPAPHGQLLVYDALVYMSAYLTELQPQILGIWAEKRMEQQVALYQAYAAEQQTLEAQPTYVRYIGDEDVRFPQWGV